MEHTTESFSLSGPPALALICTFLFIALLIPVLPGLIVAALVRRRVEKSLKTNAATVIAQYNPPRGLSSAEVGLLYDSICGEKEVRATLFELAQQNIIEFTSESAVKVIDEEKYRSAPEYIKIAIRMFDKQTAAQSPRHKTKSLIIVDNQGNSVDIPIITPLRNNHRTFTKAVQESLRKKGYKIRDYYTEFWLRVGYALMGFFMLPLIWGTATGMDYNSTPYDPWTVGSFITSIPFSIFIFFFFFPGFFIASVVAVKIFISITGRYWINTKDVRALWPELEGYRLFLEKTDIDRIQFESQNTHYNPVVKTMPYAIVFNMETKWEERLRHT